MNESEQIFIPLAGDHIAIKYGNGAMIFLVVASTEDRVLLHSKKCGFLEIFTAKELKEKLYVRLPSPETSEEKTFWKRIFKI